MKPFDLEKALFAFFCLNLTACKPAVEAQAAQIEPDLGLTSVCLRGVSYYQQGLRIVAPMFNQDGSLVLCINKTETPL